MYRILFTLYFKNVSILSYVRCDIGLFRNSEQHRIVYVCVFDEEQQSKTEECPQIAHKYFQWCPSHM